MELQVNKQYIFCIGYNGCLLFSRFVRLIWETTFFHKFNIGIKNAKFYADFESSGKVAKNYKQNILV